MKSSKVLFISPHFHPERISTGKYNSLLVRALVENGAQVEVIASEPFYPAWKPTPSNGELQGVSVHRGGGWVRYPRSMILRRAVLESWFALHALWQSSKLSKEMSIIVGVFPPSLFFLLSSCLFPSSAKRIGIVHDLQGVLGLSDGGFLQRTLLPLVHALEKGAFKSCDKLIVLSNSMAKKMMEDYGLDRDKIAVCYPFVSVRNQTTIGTNLATLFDEGFQHVVYSGALGKKQNASQLLGFFEAAATNLPGVRFHVFSEGPTFLEARQRYESNGTVRIEFHDLVEENDLEELYARSTVQVVPQLQVASGACFPSKLPNILASGCPVLAICEPDSELAQIVEEAGFGAVAHSWQNERLLRVLQKALERAKCQTHQQRQVDSRELLASRFSLELLAGLILPKSVPEQ